MRVVNRPSNFATLAAIYNNTLWPRLAPPLTLTGKLSNAEIRRLVALDSYLCARLPFTDAKKMTANLN